MLLAGRFSERKFAVQKHGQERLIAALRSAQPARVAGIRSRVSSRSQGILVAGEIALAFVLLLGAGLVIQTCIAIRTTDLGYNPLRFPDSFKPVVWVGSSREDLREFPDLVVVS